MKSLAKILSQAATEEELKNFFARFFKIRLSTKNFIDLYTPQILFEFKLDANLKNSQIRAQIVAQTLYYIRRLKFGSELRSPSQNIAVVTKNFAIFFPTKNFSAFIKKNSYDWDLAPSSPCKKLVSDLADAEIIINAHIFDFSVDESVFIDLINQNLENQLSLFELKQINEQNFYQTFQIWQKLFGAAVDNGRKASEYFLIDIEAGKSFLTDKSVIFRMNDGELVEKFVNIAEYKHFWSVYEKISDSRAIIAIRQRMDRMSEINLRRFTGEFFTPINFAQKAVDYLRRTVKFDKNWRIWDMAAGTGNLEFALPAEWLKFTYISTLLDDDADYCAKIFPEATVFQYDYLNDDVNFFGNEILIENLGFKRKMPKKLLDDLKNPALKWIIFINPPYATANNYERDKSSFNKEKVSMTAIRKLMIAENLGQSSQELFSQFIYRISREFSYKKAYLGIFSKLKYINAEADQKLRDKIFKYKFECGFVFNSKNFEGCKGKFPVGFVIWNLSKQIPLENQKIALDVFNSDVEKFAEKIIYTSPSKNFLNKWVERPKCTKKFPPMVSGKNFGFQNKNRDDLVAENFLASIVVKGNDFLNQNSVQILSAPYASGHDISITEKNFESAMILHLVMRLPKANWLNDRDQFMQPTKILPREFITDCVLWSLFSASNQTVSLRNVEYEGEIYRIRNNFYPFLLSEVKKWSCTSPEIKLQLAMAHEDRFAAIWIKNNALSVEASEILYNAREIYKEFYAELCNLDVKRFKISDWDAGWYQIRNALGKTVNLDKLSAKLLPQIYELGFLRDEVRYF